MDRENESALSAQEAEMVRLGLTPASKRASPKAEVQELDDDDDDIEELEDEGDEKSDESKEEESKEDSKDKKGIPFKQFNELRKELREANHKIAEMATRNAELEAKLPDDFEQRVDDLAKEIGVEDPEGLKKITSLMKDVMKGQTAGLEKKLADLESKIREKEENEPLNDEFNSEWDTFEETFTKDYPNATKEQVKAVQKLMNELSHEKGVGGKSYVDDKGREALDPYPLDYIFFKNKDKFESIVTKNRNPGMETARSNAERFKDRGDSNENKPLSKNAPQADILAYEKRANRALAESGDRLSVPIDDTI